ncbi:MAG: PD-(D/E)XK nuclease-like domain-containing protein [Pseudobacter sp.]|uniref:PD-(D/E)XK nuclease-like domain-containing protein n=1 Tax=Pseudobacter sp. TaxID=2045420 RepID=UPI003F7F7FC3
MLILSNRQQQIDAIVSALMSHDMHLSYSSLSAFKRSPVEFIDYKLGVRDTTDSMEYGSMLHCLVLEPDDFRNRYHTIDDREVITEIGGEKPRATKKYKQWYSDQVAAVGNKKIVDTNDYITAEITARNIRTNRASQKVLDLAWLREKPIEWEFKNFKFKGFIDGDGHTAIFDLKTCADATPNKFQRDIISRGYYLQAAMYLYAEGKMKDYYIIAADKKNGVSVHKLEPKLIELGMIEYDNILNRFNHCILTDGFDQSYDFWSDRVDGIYNAERPGYLY